MPNYQSNSNKDKTGKDLPEKNVEKVVSGDVSVKKPPLRQRVKALFISGDAQSVSSYLFSDVVLPAVKNIIVDAASEGIKRMIYGDRGAPNRSYSNGSTRVTYNSPVQRSYRDPREMRTTPYRPAPEQSRVADPFILTNKQEAELVLERMSDIIEIYTVVSVADLHELVGFPVSHSDNKWGWENIHGATVAQTRDGYLIDLPPAIPI